MAAKAKAKKAKAEGDTETAEKKDSAAKGEPSHDDHSSLISHSVCGVDCVSSFNVSCDIRSDIPREASWLECFPLKSTVELVTKWGLDPESIVSRLANPLGGRLIHNVDSLGIIGANRWVRRMAALRYRPTFLQKPPVQRKAPASPVVSDDASAVLDK